jgi:hypothetical protein
MTPAHNKQLQRTVMDKVPGYVGHRAAAENAALYAKTTVSAGSIGRHFGP